jgi:hypothetical protein
MPALEDALELPVAPLVVALRAHAQRLWHSKARAVL